MNTTITKISSLQPDISIGALVEGNNCTPVSVLSAGEIQYATTKLEKNSECVIQKLPNLIFLSKIDSEKEDYRQKESARVAGAKLFEQLEKEKIDSIQLTNYTNSGLSIFFLEGLLLASYKFDKYKKEKSDFVLRSIFIYDAHLSELQINETQRLVQAVFAARDLVNEPLSYLTATQLSKEIEKLGQEAGFSVEVFNKQKIEALKMGGLLAVNRGSIDPPTFNILEWKPENAQNKQPIVLVGKGIVFDTGGLSLKPTPNSMDFMKSDMAGSAAVIATIYALALNKVPAHVIALVPATDNRPDGNAYVPGDVITMFDGTTVEVKNTDAEGRLILADALAYAKKYTPELVIDIATLTGAADIVAGPHAAVTMGNTPETLQQLKKTGLQQFERLIEVPLWEEYAEPLKSKIADLNNLGTREAQSTIAGKFLEHFTDYHWIHIDTAGTAFRNELRAYLPAGGTGFGTRLLYHFIKECIEN